MDERLKAAVVRARDRLDKAAECADDGSSNMGLAGVIQHLLIGAADLALSVVEDELDELDKTGEGD